MIISFQILVGMIGIFSAMTVLQYFEHTMTGGTAPVGLAEGRPVIDRTGHGSRDESDATGMTKDTLKGCGVAIAWQHLKAVTRK